MKGKEGRESREAAGGHGQGKCVNLNIKENKTQPRKSKNIYVFYVSLFSIVLHLFVVCFMFFHLFTWS